MAAAPLAERLIHIIAAIDHLDRMWAGKCLADFNADAVLIAASERFLERICEAAKHIPDAHKAAHSGIPWHQIRGLGNRLRHGYEDIDTAVLWDIIASDLGPLRTAVNEIAVAESNSPTG